MKRNNRSSNNRKLGRRRKKRIAKDRFRREHNRSFIQTGRFASDILHVRLLYQSPTATRSVTSSQAMNWGYRSSAYDPDPLLLTGAIPGFAELSNLYMEYCVHKMVLNIEVVNQETSGIIFVAWPSNVYQNSNSLTQADLAEYSGNLRATSAILGATTGMNRVSRRINASAMSLVGPRYKYDLDYSSSVSNNPVEMYYINIGCYSPIANFNFPVIVRERITYHIEFFKLRQLET